MWANFTERAVNVLRFLLHAFAILLMLNRYTFVITLFTNKNPGGETTANNFVSLRKNKGRCKSLPFGMPHAFFFRMPWRRLNACVFGHTVICASQPMNRSTLYPSQTTGTYSTRRMDGRLGLLHWIMKEYVWKKDNEEQDSLHTAKRNIHGKEEETTFVQTCTGASAVNSTKSGPLLSIQRTLKFKIFAPCASRWNCWVRRGLRRVRLMACCQQQPLPQILWPKENRRDNRSGGGGAFRGFFQFTVYDKTKYCAFFSVFRPALGFRWNMKL